jgi:cobalt/nickel transport system ATP-binding protein
MSMMHASTLQPDTVVYRLRGVAYRYHGCHLAFDGIDLEIAHASRLLCWAPMAVANRPC